MRRTQTGRSRPLTIAVAILLMMGLAVPAWADRPFTLTVIDEFPDVNPCSEEIHLVSITTELRIHEHDKSTVITGTRTGVTDSGFEMINGTLHEVTNANIVSFGLMDIWQDPTTGEKFRAKVTVIVDLSTETVQVFQGGLTCVGS